MKTRFAVPVLNDEEWLRREYEELLRPATHIARDLGCHPKSVYEAMRRHGIQVRPKSRASRLAMSGNDFDDARAVALYEAGVSADDLARILHASKTTILYTLRRKGVQMRTKREAALLRRDVTARRMPKASLMIGELGVCAACGREDSLELHHVNADPEDNRTENLIALCWEHHMLIEMLVTKALCGMRLRGLLDRIQ